MAINYIANDPAVAGAQAQPIVPLPDRPASDVTFAIANLPPEQIFNVDTDGFVAWQAREAALRALNTFEAFAGPLPGWTGNPSKKKLDLRPNEGQDLNAYYDRTSVSFFEFPIDGNRVFSGASTDVVAHEVGHAILDALRPDLWSVQMFEVPAFHEGFGDCIAIMTALADQATRVNLLAANPTLAAANFVEATAEQLSFAVARAISPNHNASKPRRAVSAFQWALPQTLPADGRPEVLINEIHSFGQLTSGCYYELIREIFLANQGGEQGLLQACQTATKLLAQAAIAAPIRPRFLETIGRTMILVDRSQFNAANEAFIRAAFQRHGIALSVTSFLAPRVALAPGRAEPRRQTGTRRAGASAGDFLSAPAKRFLHSLLDVDPKAKLATTAFGASGDDTSQVTTQRTVDLTGISERLANVKCYTPYSTLVGTSGGAPAVLGAIDPAAIISSEVRDYVATLVRRGQVDFTRPDKAKRSAKKGAKKQAKAKKSKAGKRAKRGAGYLSQDNRPTHVLRRRGTDVVIERVNFSCGCHPMQWRCFSA